MSKLVTIQRCKSQGEAALIVSVLADSGIDAVLNTEFVTGTARVKVSEEDVESAREILAGREEALDDES